VLVVGAAGVAHAASPPAPHQLAIVAGSTSHGTPTAGPATSSKLSYPYATVADGSGDFYIADTYDNLVEKVDSTGALTIFAGNGTMGTPTPGPATSSMLNRPCGLAVDAAGDVYIADSTNNRVEKVDTHGVLSIFAGNGSKGMPTAGPATSSKLSAPRGLAVDAAGDVFIADATNNLVEKVDTHGVLSIIAGTGTAGTPTPGPAVSSKLSYPDGLAVDAAGDVFIADSGNNLVEKIDTNGDLSIIAGTGTKGAPTPGPALSSALATPSGVAVDQVGNVYIADTSNNRVDEVSGGTLTVVAGTGPAGAPTPGPAAASKLASPFGVAVDPSGDLYIADSYNNDIEEVGAPGTVAASLSEAPYAALLILVAVPGGFLIRRRRRAAATS
jgi:sugar lactone lactonase YvrE